MLGDWRELSWELEGQLVQQRRGAIKHLDRVGRSARTGGKGGTGYTMDRCPTIRSRLKEAPSPGDQMSSTGRTKFGTYFCAMACLSRSAAW